MKFWRGYSTVILVAVSVPSFTCNTKFDRYPDLYEATIQDLQSGLDANEYSSVDLVTAYLARIDEVNTQGANLRAVLETNRHALEQAAALDLERRTKGKRSPLHGIPILLKDNIATLATEGMNTTAGSYALLGSVVPSDSTVSAKLRSAGAILLGKTGMSEWAYARDWNLPSGWSGRSGQITNPYFPGADPCGSSSGSGVATAIGLAAGSLGTETVGSIICPSSYNNLVGIKPTVGLTSRAGVIPISSHYDTIGPMTRNVADAAVILSVIAGRDHKDNYTLAAPANTPDYTRFLNPDAIRGKRFGVPRKVFTNDTLTGSHPIINFELDRALETIRSLGGIVVDPADLPSANSALKNEQNLVLNIDLKMDLGRYLQTLRYTPTKVASLADVIGYNTQYKDLESPNGEGQSFFIDSQSTKGYNSTYYSILRSSYEAGRQQGIDYALEHYGLDALVLPSNALAQVIASLAGYPMLTVPLGFYPDDTPVTPHPPHLPSPAPGLPFGLAFLGTAFSEPELIGFAYAYEQHTRTRLKRRAYPLAIPTTQLQDIVGVGLKQNDPSNPDP
ncbi:glutamyl-tRNA amidotransferase subunit A [Rhizoctonia solani 123E]|uniref:Glutamyl-tRNA amidotransferase subunit A n=1 Tax=Rhizoctonia solani 123E TaxID=1423351 RepID=A0A074RQR3_9AGAM|nr:glutamyl-tRNA amidotransferase subunit A [Rhizoctonia solani 123E]